MIKPPRVFPLGAKSILLEWDVTPSTKVLEHILAIDNHLKRQVPSLIESQVVYRSLCLHFDKELDSNLMDQVQEGLQIPFSGTARPKKIWRIPVHYAPEFGPDLEESAKRLEFSVDELIQAHCATVYPVYGIGFLPGFLYLGDVPEILQLPRKPEPRMEVAAGTVGLAGRQTGIYPQTSPGGWQLLGRTPMKLFDPAQSPPCAIEVGDGVEFYAIDGPTYSLYEIQVEEGIFEAQVRDGL